MACYIRPHAIPRNNPDFTPFNPLLSFLEDFATQFQPENASSTPARRQHGACSSKRSENKPAPTYTPRFDIVETEAAYELYGELPGVKGEDLSVEFVDEKTLTVSGLVARTASSTSTLTTPAPSTEAAATTEKSEKSDKGKEKAASVEDADDFEDLSSAATTPDHVSTTAPDPETQVPDELDTTTTAATKTEAPEPKFLLSERKYGTFERTFRFQVPVEKEEVSARLRDGVLVVSVPKRVEVKRRVRVAIE